MCDKSAPTLPIAICAIMKVFDEHASKEGDTDKLSKNELKELIQKEMGPMVKEANSPDKLDDLFKCMDTNGDEQVDFPEFMMALAVFACICHGKACDMSKCKKKQ